MVYSIRWKWSFVSNFILRKLLFCRLYFVFIRIIIMFVLVERLHILLPLEERSCYHWKKACHIWSCWTTPWTEFSINSKLHVFCLLSLAGQLNRNPRAGWATSVRPWSPQRPTYLVRWPRCLTRVGLSRRPAYLTQGCTMSVPWPRKIISLLSVLYISL